MKIMHDLMDLLIVLSPAILVGPLPMSIWIRSLQATSWRRTIPWNILLGVVLNVIAGIILLINSQGFLPLSFFACSLIPVVTLLTLIIVLPLTKRIYTGFSDEPQRKKIYRLGTIIISLTPLIMMVILVLLMPAICGSGAIVCTEIP